jgi:CO dehydrogenase/acetyl-CoA synthase beta subunit
VRAIGGVDGYEVRGQIGDDLALIIDIGDREVTPAATAYMEGHVLRIINSQTPLTADLLDGNLRLRWYDTSLDAQEMGRLVYEALKREFTLKVISVNLIFDSMRINSLKPSILSYREERNRQLAKRTEDNSPVIACRACQCYSPHAFCVVSVDRPPCCGRSYDELSTLAQFTTHLEQFEIEPGVCRDRQRGSYMGVDKAASLLTEEAVNGLNLHSLRDRPHPTTAIPQCIAYYMDDLDLICILSSDYGGRAPDGKTFDTLLARAAGRQQPGCVGVSEAYIASPRFFLQEGGLARVGWMNSSLKGRLKLKIEHIATELECTNMNALREFIAQGRG